MSATINQIFCLRGILFHVCAAPRSPSPSKANNPVSALTMAEMPTLIASSQPRTNTVSASRRGLQRSFLEPGVKLASTLRTTPQFVEQLSTGMTYEELLCSDFLLIQKVLRVAAAIDELRRSTSAVNVMSIWVERGFRSTTWCEAGSSMVLAGVRCQ